MPFKITAKEKQLILKRRKVHSVVTEEDLKLIAQRFHDELSESDEFEDLEVAAKRAKDLSPKTKKAIKNILLSANKLVDALYDFSTD